MPEQPLPPNQAPSPDDSGIASPHRGERLYFFLLLCVSALVTYQYAFVCDDAFISFRYARNWADGLGLRYNLGPHVPVEGYSNFLWVVYCAVLELCNANMLLWSQLASYTSGVVLLYLVFNYLRSQCAMALPAALITAAFLGLSPPFIIWSTGGLETMSFALLLFVTFQQLVLRKEGIAVWSGALAGIGLALIRVEGIYWFLVIIILAAISRWLASQKFLRPLLTCLLTCVTAYGIYFYWRYSYYQMPVANTAYAKVSISLESLTRGACYVAAQSLTLLTPFFILPGCVVALRKHRLATGLPVALMAIAIPSYAVVVSGDFMAMGRLLVPGLAFNAILFGWLIQSCWSQSTGQKAAVATMSGLVVVIGMTPLVDLHLVPQSVRERVHFRHKEKPCWSEWTQWHRQKLNAEHWVKMGMALRERTEPGDSMARIAIGAIGYYSDLFIYDLAGLVNKRVAMRELDGPLIASPGHDKVVPVDFFAPDRPTFLTSSYYQKAPIGKIVNVIELNVRNLRELGLRNDYVVDFMTIDSAEPTEAPDYLIVWRLIKEDESAATAWRKSQQRLAKLRTQVD